MTARNTIISPTTFQIPTLQVPLELIQSHLENAQMQKDEWEQMSGLAPNYLQQDTDLYNKYKTLVNKVSEDVANTLSSGDTALALRKLQEAKRTVTREWKPGGMADVLNQRYNQDIAAKKQIEERFANDLKEGNSINYNLAKMSYSIPDVGYDPNTGKYNQIGAPDVPTYFDYTKHLQDYIKTMEPQINKVSRIQGDYVWDEMGKKYHVPGMMEAFASDPRVQQQLGIQSQYQFMQLSDEDKNRMVGMYNLEREKQNQQIDRDGKRISELLDSKNKEERRLGQSMLKEAGLYTGALDGIVGEKTKEAAKELSSKLQSAKASPIGVENLPSIFQQEEMQKLYGYANAALPGEHSLTVNQANWRAKLDAQASKMKEMIQEFQASNTPQAFPVTGKAVDVNKVVETLDIAEKTYNDLKTPLDQFAAANGIQGGAEGLIKALDSKDPAIQKLLSDSPALIQSIQNYQDAAKAKDIAANTNTQITKTFIERKGGMAMAQAYVKKRNLSKYGVTPEMLIYNPQEARRRVPSVATGYTMEGTAIQENAVDIFRKDFRQKLEEDIQSNYDAYSSAIPTGLKDNSEQFKLIEDAATKSNAFAGIPDATGKIQWKVYKKDKWEEGGSGIKTTGISILPSTSAKGGVDIQLEGVDEDGNPATRIAHVQNVEQNQFIQSWASGVIADGLNGKETDANMLVARNITRGVYEPGRVAIPENGKASKVVINGYEYDKKVNIIKDLGNYGMPQVKLGTYYDNNGNKTYAVFEEQGTTNGLPVLKIRKGLDKNNAVFSEHEYDAAWGTFDMEAVLRDPSIKLMEGKRKPSEKTEIPIQSLNLMNLE